MVVDLLEKKELTGGPRTSVRGRKGRGEGLLLRCWAKGLVGPAYHGGEGSHGKGERRRGGHGLGQWWPKREERRWAATAAKEKEREEFKPMYYFPFRNRFLFFINKLKHIMHGLNSNSRRT